MGGLGGERGPKGETKTEQGAYKMQGSSKRHAKGPKGADAESGAI